MKAARESGRFATKLDLFIKEKLLERDSLLEGRLIVVESAASSSSLSDPIFTESSEADNQLYCDHLDDDQNCTTTSTSIVTKKTRKMIPQASVARLTTKNAKDMVNNA